MQFYRIEKLNSEVEKYVQQIQKDIRDAQIIVRILDYFDEGLGFALGMGG